MVKLGRFTSKALPWFLSTPSRFVCSSPGSRWHTYILHINRKKGGDLQLDISEQTCVFSLCRGVPRVWDQETGKLCQNEVLRKLPPGLPD
eukprot:1143400-Pelagomonas_calceolata.AAC.7